MTRAPRPGDVYRDRRTGRRFTYIATDTKDPTWTWHMIRDDNLGVFSYSDGALAVCLRLIKPALWRWAFGAIG